MKAVRIVIGLALLALFVLGVFIWTLPADVGYRHFARSLGPVVLTGLRGTMWHGHADGVSVFGRDLGEMEWQLAKAPLLLGRLAAQVRIKGAGVEAEGRVVRSDDGVLGAHDLRFSIPAELLAPALGSPSLQLLGTIHGVVTNAMVRNATLVNASGNARWSDAGVQGDADARFADLLANFASRPDGSITGTVSDVGTGDLAVAGTFSLSVGEFDAQATLRARNGNPQIVRVLREIGESQSDGSSRLVVHAQMLPIL